MEISNSLMISALYLIVKERGVNVMYDECEHVLIDAYNSGNNKFYFMEEIKIKEVNEEVDIYNGTAGDVIVVTVEEVKERARKLKEMEDKLEAIGDDIDISDLVNMEVTTNE